MRITGRHVLDECWRLHPDTRSWIQNWLADAERSEWNTPADVRSSYASASFLAGGVVVFNVKGNAYRLETEVAYHFSIIAVIWMGTHAAYDVRNRKRRRRS